MIVFVFWVIFSLLAHVPACMQVNMSTKKQAYRFEVYSRKVTFFSVYDYLTLFTCIYISIYFILLFCMLFLSDCSLSDPLLHVMGTLAFPYEWPAWHCSNIAELKICFIMWLNAVSSNAVFCKSRNILQTFTKQCKQPQVFCQSMGLFFPLQQKVPWRCITVTKNTKKKSHWRIIWCRDTFSVVKACATWFLWLTELFLWKLF